MCLATRFLRLIIFRCAGDIADTAIKVTKLVTTAIHKHSPLLLQLDGDKKHVFVDKLVLPPKLPHCLEPEIKNVCAPPPPRWDGFVDRALEPLRGGNPSLLFEEWHSKVVGEVIDYFRVRGKVKSSAYTGPIRTRQEQAMLKVSLFPNVGMVGKTWHHVCQNLWSVFSIMARGKLIGLPKLSII